MLNVTLLKTFINTAIEGSLSAVAEKMDLRQPTISMQIQSVEEYFGVRLFYRRGKGMEITPEGEVVLLKAQELVATWERIERETFGEINRLKSKIVVGAGPIMTDYLLPHVIAIFKKKYPHIDVIVEPHETEDIVKGVLDYSFDVGMIGYPISTDNNKLVMEYWAHNELVLVAPPGHEFCSKKIISPEELVGQTFIWRTGVTGIKLSLLEKLAAVNVHVDLNSSYELPSTMALLSSVQAGLGLSVIPRYAAQTAIDMGMVVAVRIKDVLLMRKLYIITHKLGKPFIVREFIESAKEYSNQIL